MSMSDKPMPMVENGPAMPDKVFDLLRQAAQLLPSRFRDAPFPWVEYTYPHSWQVFMRGDWEAIWIQEDEVEWSPLWDLFLEAACREECEARGWTESLTNWRTHYAAVVRGTHDRVIGHAEAPAPSEALLRAVLMGLSAQDDV